VHVDPFKPKFKPPGTKRLKPEYDGLLSNSGFKFNLRCYTEVAMRAALRYDLVGRCRLTLSKPR